MTTYNYKQKLYNYQNINDDEEEDANITVNNIYNKNRFLFRAGRVKRMTPKVECCMGKQREREKPHGRASKRIKYNQRFKTNQ